MLSWLLARFCIMRTPIITLFSDTQGKPAVILCNVGVLPRVIALRNILAWLLCFGHLGNTLSELGSQKPNHLMLIVL